MINSASDISEVTIPFKELFDKYIGPLMERWFNQFRFLPELDEENLEESLLQWKDFIDNIDNQWPEIEFPPWDPSFGNL